MEIRVLKAKHTRGTFSKKALSPFLASRPFSARNAWYSGCFKYKWQRQNTADRRTAHLCLLMVFTVTSSDCKVKKARFYEFLFTLGWRLIGNKSLYKFPAPKHVSFRKYSSLNFRVFTVRDTKIGMLSPWKKSLRLIFSSLTISSIRRYVYAQVC